MQSHTKTAVIIGVTSVALCASFVAFTEHRRKNRSAGALDAVPAGALLVASADLAALRGSPVGAPFLREGREIPGLGKVRDLCGFDPIDSLTEVAIAIPAGGDAGDFGLVAAGPIDDEALLGCASKVIQARGGRPAVSAIGSFRAVHDDGQPAGGGEIAVRKGGPLLLGAGPYLRAMIDAADGRTATIRTSVAHGFLGREVGDASLRVTFVLSPEQRQALAQELAENGEAKSPATAIVAGAVGLRLGPAVGVHALINCDDAAACAKLATTIKSARDARAAEMGVRVLGFGAVLEKIDIQAQAELIHARVEVPAEQAASLLDILLKLRGGIRHPMPKADPTAEPAAPPPVRPPLAPDEVVKPDAGAAPSKGDAGAGR